MHIKYGKITILALVFTSRTVDLAARFLYLRSRRKYRGGEQRLRRLERKYLRISWKFSPAWWGWWVQALPFHSIYHHEQSCGVRSSREGRYTSHLWCLRLKVRLSSTFPSTFSTFLQQFTVILWNGCCAILFIETFCTCSVCYRFYCAWAVVLPKKRDLFRHSSWKLLKIRLLEKVGVSSFRQYSRIPP